MRNLLLISALLFSFNGWAEDILGTMKCTIKDQIILTMEDGVTKRYSAYEWLYKVGDSVPFKYEYDEQSSELKIMLGKFGKAFFINTFDTKTTSESNLQEKRYFVYQGRVSKSTLVLDTDSIYAELEPIWYLHLQRYFKNDWNGIFTKIVSGSTQAVAVDCRQGINRLDELLEVLDDLAEENE